MERCHERNVKDVLPAHSEGVSEEGDSREVALFSVKWLYNISGPPTVRPCRYEIDATTIVVALLPKHLPIMRH